MTKNPLTGYVPDNCVNLDHFPHIKGYDFNGRFDFDEFLKSYSSTGFQATKLGKAIEIIKAMRREKALIFLAYTSNMVSSGVREVIRYLVEKRFVDVLVTTGANLTHDLAEALGYHHLQGENINSNHLNDADLHEAEMNRIYDVFMPNKVYKGIEDFSSTFFIF